MNDLISRQEAIDVLKRNYPSRCFEDLCKAVDIAIKSLSAQPEPCGDAVSRRRLLSDLKELIVSWKKYPVMAEQIKGVEAAIGYLETIPPVTPQPERKNGKWILNKDGNWACQFCGFDPYHDNMKGMNYCPNCGAKMKGNE